MRIEVRFGNGVQSVDIPESRIRAILLPNEVEKGNLSAEDEVMRSLENPIGSSRISEMDLLGKKIAIITSDITRPLPTWQIMPSLLEELYSAGADPSNIKLIFALGSHRPHTEEEKRHLAGLRAYTEIECMDGDNTDTVSFGKTSCGTPIDIVRDVAEADVRICLGNIEYHYFAGYSGGYKAIMPGVSTYEAIQHNHRMMVEEASHAGKLEGNPVREDIEEAGAIVGVDFIVNPVLDEHKQIVKVFSGDPIHAHRAGCAFLDEMYQVKIDSRADIVIVSQGGAPKDLNLYQTQKALDNAKHAVRDGGAIILVGSCREGLGQKVFAEWMEEANCPDDLIRRVHENFKLGGHKAAAIALVMKRADVYLVSEMDPEYVESLMFVPAASLDDAFASATEKLGPESSVIVMPYGGSTLPCAEKAK